MRSFDKKNHIKKANLLAEQRYLKKNNTLGIILESEDNVLHLALDNGGRPFITKVEKNFLNIYKNEFQYKYTKVFDGTDEGGDKDSTILVKIDKNRYLFVGLTIYEFDTEDEIQKYSSPIGNSAVPYPVAIGSKNVYFMLEREYVSKEELDKAKKENGVGKFTDDYYGVFYNNQDNLKIHDMKKIKEIQDRL